MRPIGLCAALLLLGACETPPPPVPFVAVTDIHGLMEHVLEPAADVIWDSAGSVVTLEGEQKLAPTTDEGWLAVVHQATVIAESGNTLMLPIYAKDQGDWVEISQGLVRAGVTAIGAAQAHDEEALFEAGAQLYSVCVSCHQLYMVAQPE